MDEIDSEIGPQEKDILVTGGRGFIGSHLCRVLATHNDIVVLDDGSNPAPAAEYHPESVTVVDGDVRDEPLVDDLVAETDIVFHEAAEVSVQRSIETPGRSHSVNVGGTLNVLEAARTHDARVVVASSCAIYGSPESVPLSESHPKQPNSPYGLEKLTVDHYTRLYNRLYDIPTVALRYFNVYGPGQSGGEYSGVVSIFQEQARNGGPLTVEGDGTQTRDFVHVNDVVRANLLAATTERVGTAYNVGTGTETTIRELAETIRDMAQTDATIVHRDSREGDIERSCADVSKAHEELDYEPTVSLREGLASLV
ncbi:NAD-dependent epimerase/dehydratase family protein [Halorussus salilacus]|uniref:NAD-dependent epimerase/dehydratase family protein n=1 Tax=Halorussus salilacus TaxID=2953750 RepID=UPI00209FB861|nr:NAD-dependent epimerase/dehydratase family protein [Halorussus salilacus]USZ67379.1 NAD-dependent epimerase/dehydratase family protein [Halorussus salilacus]